MDGKDRVTPRQFTAAAFVGLLSPMLRRFPRALAAEAGRGGWTGPLFALPVLAALWGLAALLWRRHPGLSWPALLREKLGAGAGRLLSVLYGVWLLGYAGFLLRSDALRLQSTVYHGASTWLLVGSAALLCGIAGAGRFRDLARFAMVLRPLLLTVPLLLFCLSLRSADWRLLVPLSRRELGGGVLAGLELGNLLAVAGLLAFFRDRCPGPVRLRDWGGWGLGLLGLEELMAVACLAVFGPDLTADLRFPFFLLARDAAGGSSLERFEPLIIAVWVFADFVFLSCLLKAAALALWPEAAKRRTEVPQGGERQKRPFPLPALLCAAGATAAALLLPGDTAAFQLLSERLVPLLSAVMTCGIPLLVLCLGAMRKRI